MWVVDLTVVHEGVARSKTCGFYTREAVVDLFETLLHEDDVLTFDVRYDEKPGKRGDR